MTAHPDQHTPHGRAHVEPGGAADPVDPAPEAPAGGQPPQSPAPIGPHAAPATVQHTKLGGLWLMLSLGAVFLVLLLVFILMNTETVLIHIYGGHWNAPLGVALLMASALGVLLVLVPGGGRILQLKRAARKLHKERESLVGRLDQANADAAAAPPTTPTE